MNVAIIGGGASGIMCALSLKRQSNNINVTVYEKLPRILKKIFVTGNGRCNLTNLNSDSGGYWGNYDFAKYALEKYNANSNIDFFNLIGLLTKVEDEGRVYPMSSQASSVVNVLRCEAEKLGVDIVTDVPIKTIKKTDRQFVLNESIYADCVVVAAGGSAAKAHGTQGDSFKLLSSLGLNIITPSPALTGVIIKGFPKTLKGIRNVCKAELFVDGNKVYEELGEIQFNDYGISGIPVMQLSGLISQARSKNIYITLDCLPEVTSTDLLQFIKLRKNDNPLETSENALCGVLPKAMANQLMLNCNIKKDMAIGEVDNLKIDNLISLIKDWKLKVECVRDFEFAQVTAGGVDCNEFSKETLECKKIKDLYCAGEVFDLYGRCGGYNLQWAWSSGRLVADSIIKGE